MPENQELFTGGKNKWKKVGPLKTSFNKTNLDLENPYPLGGPIRMPLPINGTVPKNFKGVSEPAKLHQWTPTKTYMDSIIGKPKTPPKPPSNSIEYNPRDPNIKRG